ncbi:MULTISPECIES: Xaa-Pro peptidase family protein [Haloferax]|uniref:M24 family metallopeptidase n=2 Tax=Haloferax TaxID=2251 RepID=A0A6G1YYA0_9EURY|nr:MULTISPECIES: Xaa-Pro peptidase family protein [Haloferax]KAB1186643.1 aminopeptidase P family protein [Haloferax sp. CBA1149]MRW79262.1 M24 family metallopeptidase [Haloferax marinisediminis]
MSSRLPSSEFAARLDAIRGSLVDTVADAALWFDATNIEYLSGFNHVQTERPVALVVTDDRVELVVPRLELERASEIERLDRVRSYFDYPQSDPIGTVVETLRELDVRCVAADMDSAPGTMGYHGPSLSDSVEVVEQAWADRMRWEKTDAEIDCIRESVRWANLGHQYLANLTTVGAHPITVSQRASMEASRAMLDTLGDRYVVRTRGVGPVHVGYISGSQTARPHGYTPNERLSEGDVIITGATANVDGYHSELERTMFLGDPSDDDRYYFELMLEAQELAIDALGPDVPVDYVDHVVWEYFEEQGVADLAQHHVGHNIGLGAHEPPYLDRGWADHCADPNTDHTESDADIGAGQVYTIEPGLYTETAGYRHSDTVLVTDSGTETLTYFPRDIESNTIRA